MKHEQKAVHYVNCQIWRRVINIMGVFFGMELVVWYKLKE